MNPESAESYAEHMIPRNKKLEILRPECELLVKVQEMTLPLPQLKIYGKEVKYCLRRLYGSSEQTMLHINELRDTGLFIDGALYEVLVSGHKQLTTVCSSVSTARSNTGLILPCI